MLTSSVSFAISPENVLVLYNVDSSAGIEITDYYSQAHPGVQTLGLIGVTTDEQVSADDYLNIIRPQVLAALNTDIDVIVTTKGLPLHIEVQQANPGTYPGWRGNVVGDPVIDGDQWFNYSSLESELMRIDRIASYQEMGDQFHILSDSVFGFPLFGSEHQARNPYYGASDPFRHDDPNKVALDRIRLSTRLDAFTVDDVKAMIDRSYLAVVDPPNRDFIIDEDPATFSTRMDELAVKLTDMGVTHQYDITHAAITQSVGGNVLGYVSLGTNDGPGGLGGDYIHSQLDLNLANGAVFASYESYNASTFDPLNSQYQALIAEWIEIGGTAALGQVWEGGDGADNVTNEDLFFEYMLSGYTFAEAFAYSTLQLSYINTAIGDPLMRWVPRHAGDANLDQIVNTSDLAILTINFLQTGGWSEGDFNGDGLVNPSDLAIMTLNFGMTNPALDPGDGSGTNAVVPEPELGLWMLIAGVALLARRGHRAHRVRMSLAGKVVSD